MNSLNFSAEPSARPPETMTLAEPSSGRSDLATSSPLKLDRPGSAAADTASTGALPVISAALNEAVRTVSTFLASADCTVWMALPA